ncbi:MAG: hypothetical protein R6X08_01585, partial [Desulfosalsimonadaceae bacterium]
ERRMLRAIEGVTRQKIELLELPTTEMINNKRIARFKQTILDTLATNDLGFFHDLMDELRQAHDVPALNIAAALAKMAQGEGQMLMPELSAGEQQKPKTRPFTPKGSFKKNPPSKTSARPARKKKGKKASQSGR